MTLHQASGHWRLGLTLSLATALFWATLPIALKLTLELLDPITLTWFRFLVAAAVTAAWLGWRGRLRGFGLLTRRRWAMLLVAALMLVGNYVFYLLGVQHTTPANAQLLIQLAPLLMALGGIWVFGERFRAAQWLGLLLLAGGMLLFFGDQLRAAAQAPGYVLGSAFVVLGALVWAVYALLQKQLLLHLGSMQILLAIYVVATLALWPFAQPSALLRLDALHWALLGYCAFNTIAAYGAFAEALAHWEASRVSAVLATTPLLCIAAVAATHALWPQLLAPERIAPAGWLGAVLVVAGSAAVSLLGRRGAR
ncbi:DMT family transporter [Vulcaniibacterium gelatinicum]|uniref:DMT family transporter n=1 Tax=Vulcaniibacterium gelatinicum TaxID=2598725 RepID=UPI0011CC2D9E|nr:DMT family transporter [Vulcaniibacterium gelatinicum]